MNILIGCEHFATVRDAFKMKGHNAVSCDFKPSVNGGNHYRGNIKDLIYSHSWDLFICFPPCTHLAVSGAKHFHYKVKSGQQKKAIDFFMEMVNAPIEKICIENPIGIMSTKYRKPDQIIQPYYFGDPFQKTTCLWLKNLPKLFHAKKPDLFNSNITHTDKGETVTFSSGKKMAKWLNEAKTGSKEKTATTRSKTFSGIAEAMANTWS